MEPFWRPFWDLIGPRRSQDGAKLDKKEQQDFILKELLQDTFQGCPVFMKISGNTFKGAALELLDALKYLPNVYS